ARRRARGSRRSRSRARAAGRARTVDPQLAERPRSQGARHPRGPPRRSRSRRRRVPRRRTVVSPGSRRRLRRRRAWPAQDGVAHRLKVNMPLRIRIMLLIVGIVAAIGVLSLRPRAATAAPTREALASGFDAGIRNLVIEWDPTDQRSEAERRAALFDFMYETYDAS